MIKGRIRDYEHHLSKALVKWLGLQWCPAAVFDMRILYGLRQGSDIPTVSMQQTNYPHFHVGLFVCLWCICACELGDRDANLPCIHVEAREKQWVPPSDSLPYPLKTEFLAEPESCHLGAELTDKQAPALGQQTHEAMPNMLHGFWDLNSDLSSWLTQEFLPYKNFLSQFLLAFYFVVQLMYETWTNMQTPPGIKSLNHPCHIPEEGDSQGLECMFMIPALWRLRLEDV